MYNRCTRKIIVCVKNPMSKRDLLRMGIKDLSDQFNLKVFNLTPWLLPRALQRPHLRCQSELKIHSTIHFILQVFKYKPFFAIDYFGLFSFKAYLAQFILKIVGCKIIVIDSGAHASHFINQNKNKINPFFSSYLRKKIKYLYHFLVRPHIAITAGSSWKINPRFFISKNKIQGHSFDYETILKTNSMQTHQAKRVEKNIVYIDEKIFNHEDNEELSLSAPATKKNFLPAIRKIFSFYEKKIKKKVIICGYPTNNAFNLSSHFRRRAYLNKTCNLIKKSKLVLVHASASLSFAVCYFKPIIFLTSNEIKRHSYHHNIAILAMKLGRPIVNIDDPASWKVKTTINKKLYLKYIKEFICENTKNKKLLWTKFLLEINKKIYKC